MNYRIVLKFLSAVAIFLGVCMLLCLPWAAPCLGGDWTFEARGAGGLLKSALAAFAVGLVFYAFGRRADGNRLFRKEAIAIVTLSWTTAIVLGALPYLFSGSQRAPGVSLSPTDALFESASGFTTTGATIFSELENPASLPRTILFWRGTTHFLGGLGVMCFFVVLLGQGTRGKAIMKLEHNLNGGVPIAKMRVLAFSLFTIYISLNFVCFLFLLLFGMNVYDAISHAFSAIATGGFSTRNASVGYYAVSPGYNGVGIELVLIVFMILAATNFWLLYWVALGKPGKLLRDSEWRTFLGLVIVGIISTFAVGLYKGDFDVYGTSDAPLIVAKKTDETAEAVQPIETADDGAAISDAEIAEINDFSKTEPQKSEKEKEPNDSKKPPTVPWPTALRLSAFNVVSLATGAGFATDQFERWSASSLVILGILIFCGGCSGSSAGGAKIYRIVLAAKELIREPERLHSPNVVRATRLDGENVDKETTTSAFVYLIAFVFLIFATTAFVVVVEPDDVWTARGTSQAEKSLDLTVGTLSMYANVGPGFGALGARENFGNLTETTKFVYCWSMLLGRLEIWAVLALFSPRFWRNR